MKKGTLHVFGSIYSPSEPAVVYAQIFDETGEPANDATVKLTLFKPDGTKVLDSVSMTYIAYSNGLYKYEFTASSDVSRLVVDVKSTNPTAYGTEDIYVSKWTYDVTAIKAVTDNLPDNGSLITIINHLTDIKGPTWTNENLKLIKELVDELETGEKPPRKRSFSL